MHTIHVVLLYLCLFAVIVPGSQLLIELGAGEGGPPWVLVRRFWGPPVPKTAVVLVAVQVVMGVAQLVHPAIIGQLEREPDGGWWRPLTALLVQSDGGVQLVFNLAAIVAVAPVANRVLGAWRTVAIFLVAGVAAQVVSAVSWSPRGGGDSVAICGLVGALAVGYAMAGARPALRRLALLVPAAAVVLCVLTNNHGVGLLVGCLAGPLVARSWQNPRAWPSSSAPASSRPTAM